MSEVRYQVCDRCKKEFKFSRCKWSGYFLRGIRKKNRICFHSMYYGNISGLDYSNYEFDLCGECTEKLIKFLQGSELENKL